MSRALEQTIKDSLASNKCNLGVREVLRKIDNSKLVVCSESLSDEKMQSIVDSAKKANIPVYNYGDTSINLGRLCNKPFRISVLSIDKSSDSDISAILDEIDKKEE